MYESTTNRLQGSGVPTISNSVSAPSVGVAVQVGVVHGGLHLHPPADVTVPRQVPVPPGPFTGRVDELATLDRLLGATGVDSNTTQAAPAPALVVIGGVGGIGKTWLALQWAHRNATRFPDGQLFVDLRGFGPEGCPVPPTAVLHGFLVALGMRSDAVPDDLRDRATLFRSLTTDLRLMVLLDNAVDSDQILPLLPGGAGCTVVVTSRRVLNSLVSRHGAHHVRLDVLSGSEARSLVARKVGAARAAAEPRAVEELIGFCKGFPLALGVLAARAHVHTGIPLAEFATELRDTGTDGLDDDDPTTGIFSVLSWSYRALTTEQKRTFALLGIAPGPDIGLPAAANLIGLPITAAGRALRALVDTSLLNRNANGRYSMHDLVRSYSAATARHDLTDRTRTTSLLRIVDYYLHTARAADRLMYPHREPAQIAPPVPGVRVPPLSDAAAALAWFIGERPNLLAAQHLAAGLNRPHAVWQLAWAHSTFHAWRGHSRDRLVLWQAAVAAAGELPDPAILALTLRHLGRAHARLGQHDEAHECLGRALVLTEDLDDPTNEAHTHYQLARTLGRKGDLVRAIEHAAQARMLYRSLDKPVWEADALIEMSKHEIRLGDHDRARDDCRTALATHRRHENPGGEAAAWENLGHIERAAHDHHTAIGHYQRALALYLRLGSTSEAATTLDNLGQAHATLGQHRPAQAAWAEASTHYREQDRHSEALRVQERLNELTEQT